MVEDLTQCVNEIMRWRKNGSPSHDLIYTLTLFIRYTLTLFIRHAYHCRAMQKDDGHPHKTLFYSTFAISIRLLSGSRI